MVIVGSPNTVREKLAEYQDLAGFNTSLTKTQFGTHAGRHGARQHDGDRARRCCRTSATGCRRAPAARRRSEAQR